MKQTGKRKAGGYRRFGVEESGVEGSGVDRSGVKLSRGRVTQVLTRIVYWKGNDLELTGVELKNGVEWS